MLVVLSCILKEKKEELVVMMKREGTRGEFIDVGEMVNMRTSVEKHGKKV